MKHALKSAAKVTIFENNAALITETEAVHDRIRQRAFELSQVRDSDALARFDWVTAESEVVSVPPVEIREHDGKYEVRFAVAGVDPYNINVMVTPEQILLKSAYNHQHDSQVGTVHFCDFKATTIFRLVTLPQPIDVNSVGVDYFDGILLVRATKQGVDDAATKGAPSARKTSVKKSRSGSPKQP